ncbi:MAG: DNA polymerase III subunit alpha [Halothiobacillaceae bacterium]|nr:MAG: DNA polymerase III subunit alpha [Halothiobacillaceae bacterium]
MTAFVHLRLHTEYSLVDGTLRIKPLMKRAAELGIPALALTDQGNLFAFVKFYKAAQGAGIKPILGVDVILSPPQSLPRSGGGDRGGTTRLTLLAQNNDGFRNLTRLVSRGYMEGLSGGVAMLDRDWLTTESCAGIIALSGGREGEIGQALLGSQPEQADGLLAHWMGVFPDRFYLEVTRTGRPGEEDVLHRGVELAARMGAPVVATNDVRFLAPDDFEAHEVRVCIHEGRILDDPKRPRRYSEQQYLRSPQEMAELFADLPEAIENTVEIARRCSVGLTLGKPVLPQFPIPAGMTEAEFITQESEKGLEERLAAIIKPDDPGAEAKRAEYHDRLKFELGTILQMGFPGYFLIVADFIQWAKRNGIPVGPGRGSGAGSLVAYALKITDLDPIPYDLLFERFLNPERVSMPDFDVDFCMERRDEVIDYVARTYGRESVSQIITYGSMAAKAVIRDVGRVLGNGYGFVDGIAKLIPNELGISLKDAIEKTEDLKARYEHDEEVKAILDMGLQLEGLSRNAGKHAGGVVIAPGPLTDFTPLYRTEGEEGIVSQLDKDDVESIGLVKFDFLGLRTLTIIDWAMKTLNGVRARAGQPPLAIEAIDLQDRKAFELLKACQTTAVFQLESRGMKDLVRRLQPDCFEDVIALVALFRPGPLESGMVDDFIARKHGRAAIEYPHPDLEPILKPTYGVIVYQEQVMQIAQVLARYSLGGADLLRRAMGKKKPEEMAQQREIFLAGATGRGVDAGVAGYIFDLMEKFAGYGFNKSHSAAYALVSVQTAWLKAHYPAAFMAAVLSADMDNTDKVVVLIEECRTMGLKVEPPRVNDSDYRFTIRDDATVVYGLGAIKGVGQGAIESVLEARAEGGAFRDLHDFVRRVDRGRLNRRVLEAMIRAGALDGLGPNRASLMAALPDALKLAEAAAEQEAAGQGDLFGMFAGDAHDEAPPVPVVQIPEWDDFDRLSQEKDVLGLYLTGHPIQGVMDEIRQFSELRLGELTSQLEDVAPRANGRPQERHVVVAGLMIGVRPRITQQGEKEAFLLLDDGTGRIEARLFPEDYTRHAEQLGEDQVLVLEGGASFDNFSGGVRLRVKSLMTLDQAREAHARELRIVLGANFSPDAVATLADTLAPFRPGRCPVHVDLRNGEARGRLALGDGWRITPSGEMLRRLRLMPGVDRAELFHARTATEPSRGGEY